MKLVIVSGRSGSGKSVVLDTLEDLDYYCIDNLPLALLSQLSANLSHRQAPVAVSIDARNTGDLHHFEKIIADLKSTFDELQIVYLDADDDTLLKRFRETRRKHPLNKSGLSEAIIAEKKMLTPITYLADLRIDSSHLSAKQLRAIVQQRIHRQQSIFLSIMLQSFAYKNGIPLDTDFVFDVRCLPNPYWVPGLRDKTGRDPEVIDYFKGIAQSDDMYEDIKNFLKKWFSIFENDGRKYLTISIGCTGGQHRSVYLTELLGSYLSQYYDGILIRHRELDN